MKNKISIIIFYLCVMIIILTTMAFAADTDVTITISTDGKPTETSGTGWNYSNSVLTLNNGYNFTFTGNTCTVAIENNGTIVEGTFNGTVTNGNKGKINGGSFHGTVNNGFQGISNKNTAYIDGGIFYGEVINMNPCYITEGTFTDQSSVIVPFGSYITGGTFYGEIKSYWNGNAYTSGQISGGTFYGNMDSFLSGGWASIKGGNYAINYELNGGTWIDENNVLDTYTYSTTNSIALPTENDIYKYGYTFMGWYENKNFTGQPIKSIAKQTKGVKTFYAYFVEGDVEQPIYDWEIAGNTAVEGTDYDIDVEGNYTIYTALGLAKISNIVNKGDNLSRKTVTLENDIDLYEAGVLGYEKGGNITSTNSWIPINGFAGTFDGNGKRIENLYIYKNIADNVKLGLFASNTGTIKNLILASGEIKLNIPYVNKYVPVARSYYVGGIVASASGVIDNCANYVILKVTSDEDAFEQCDIYMGGIVASSANGAIVSNCINYAKITSSVYASALARGGGIVGNSGNLISDITNLIDNCYNYGDVSLESGYASYAGGIAGYVQTSAEYDDSQSIIRNSGNEGTIGGTYAGGMAGFCDNKASIFNSYNLGYIYATKGLYAGGIVGYGDRYNDVKHLEIINCYNAGNVSGAEKNGGIAGRLDDGYISNCYYLSSTQSDVVGLDGSSNTNTISNAYAFIKSEDTYTFVDNGQNNIELLNALNNWVFSNEGNGYLNWVTDAKKENYPVLGSIEYLITFDAGEGSLPNGIINPVATKNGKLSILPVPTREGYVFENWLNGETIVSVDTVYTDSIILTAKWVPVYDVILHTNGGTIADGKNVTFYIFGEGATLPNANEITYTGYIFDGWYESSDFNGHAVTEITVTDENNKEFWAKWKKIEGTTDSDDVDHETDTDDEKDTDNKIDTDFNSDSDIKDDTPNTGDNILLFVELLGISVIGIFIIRKFRKSKKH